MEFTLYFIFFMTIYSMQPPNYQLEVVRGDVNESASQICRSRNLEDSVATSENLDRLTSLLKATNVPHALVGAWHDDVVDHVVHATGAVAPFDSATHSTNHAFCLRKAFPLKGSNAGSFFSKLSAVPMTHLRRPEAPEQVFLLRDNAFEVSQVSKTEIPKRHRTLRGAVSVSVSATAIPKTRAMFEAYDANSEHEFDSDVVESQPMVPRFVRATEFENSVSGTWPSYKNYYSKFNPESDAQWDSANYEGGDLYSDE